MTISEMMKTNKIVAHFSMLKDCSLLGLVLMMQPEDIQIFRTSIFEKTANNASTELKS